MKLYKKFNVEFQTPLQIGITGGIGSGKTTVCKIFELLGIPIYLADDRAKLIMTENQQVIEQIVDQIGVESYYQDGQLNRAYLADLVFKDAGKLETLNSIVHPAVREDSLKWHNAQKRVPYTLKEAALLVESGSYKLLDKIIVVTAPKELRVKRVMKRDHVNEESVIARMKKQMLEEEKVKYADFIIVNDGKHSLINQVWAIHHKLLDIAQMLNA